MISYTSGQNNYQTTDYNEITGDLVTTFTEQPIFKCGSMKESIENDIRSLGNRKIAVMFSGGMDSEIVLEACRDIKADYYAVFCLYTYRKMPVNTHELYHVEKYCRENSVQLKTVELDLEWFYEGGEFLEYSKKYLCNFAQICAYLWIIDQIDDYLLLGGDAPHITSTDPLTFFAPLLGQCSVERKFAMDGRTGIPNMLTHSLTTMCYCLKLWQDQFPKTDLSVAKRVLKVDDPRLTVPNSPSFAKQVFPRWAYTTIKHGMYRDGGFSAEIKPKYSSPFALLADIKMSDYDTEIKINTRLSTVMPCHSLINYTTF